MFPLSHLGIGNTLARPFAKPLPFRWLLLGTLLPDLIDKPFYLLLGLVEYLQTGGWVPGKRGVAHTFVFLAVLAVVAAARRSKVWTAIALGTATHLLLDFISKLSFHHSTSGVMAVLLWPAMGWTFPALSNGMHGTEALLLEVFGGALLVAQFAVKRFRTRAK